MPRRFKTNKIMPVAFLILIGILVAIPFFALGQQTATTPSPVGTGILRIKSDVSAVRVMLDDTEIGLTPITLPNVSAGRHHVSLIKGGFKPDEREVSVTASQTTSIFAVLIPFDTELPKLPVTYTAFHKHVSGGCFGVLTINAESVDFKADKGGGDQFHLLIRDMKAVARSLGGGVVFAVPTGGGATLVGVGASPALEAVDSLNRPGTFKSTAGVESLTTILPLRIDLYSDKGYGFWLFDETIEEPARRGPAEVTKDGFDLLYRLWTADLSVRPSKKKL